MNRIALTLFFLLATLSLPLAAATQDSIPQDTIPQDTIPQDTIPQDSILQDSTFLTLVDTLKRGDQIVIERTGFVLDEQSPKSGALLSTRTFITTNLTGDESYLWTLVPGIQGFYLCSRNEFYINLNSTNQFVFDHDAPKTQWVFEFAEDSTATIFTADKKRFIGETAAYSGQYKTYSNSNSYRSVYGHTFRIYRLDRPLPPDPEPTTLDHTPFPSGEGRGEAHKLLRNGHLFILHSGKTYNVLGQPVR